MASCLPRWQLQQASCKDQRKRTRRRIMVCARGRRATRPTLRREAHSQPCSRPTMCGAPSSSSSLTLTLTRVYSSSIDFISTATITSYNSTGSAHTRSIPRESRKARMTPCCGERVWGARAAGRAAPLGGTPHTQGNPSTALLVAAVGP